MLICAVNIKGIIRFPSPKKRQPSNQDLEHLWQSICQKASTFVLTRGFCVKTTYLPKSTFGKETFWSKKLLEHPPHLPDLALRNVFMFPEL
jgi:hypothetical protein